MKYPVLFFFVLLLPLGAADPAIPAHDESLAYSINYASGLSLGEARLISRKANDRWFFDMVLDAGVPGFPVSDHFRSTASLELCSIDFERETLHGKKRSREKTTFDYKKDAAHRVTANGGGKTDVKIGACAHDALALVYHARRELARGKVPPAQQVFFGAQYRVKLEFTGAQTVTYSEKRAKADRVAVSLKGPASDVNFEIFFAQDARRTPLLVKAPLPVGVISMELVP
jgi:hypothetical protein